jgi:hypothetical protein
MHGQVSQYVDANDMLHMRFLEKYMSDDTYPFVDVFSFSDVASSSETEPGPDYEMLAQYRASKTIKQTYIRKDGSAVIYLSRNVSRDERFGDSVSMCILSKSDGLAAEVKKRIKGKIETFVYETDEVEIGFWQQTPSGAGRTRRFVAPRPWDTVRQNYSADVADTLGRLMKTQPTTVDGRIILLHGMPGGGKTNLLRALAHTWRDWASLEYVIDPENFLNSGSYISSVMLDQSVYNSAQKDKWRVIALEDAGELITADAKQKSGQALSRLLNIADGLLGEGTNVILAITTNENISALHPALTRPGRCMLKAEVGKLSEEEAKAWIGPEFASEITGPMTLAELFHIKNGLGKEANTTKEVELERPGLYM